MKKILLICLLISLWGCQPALINLPKVDCPKPIILECPVSPVIDVPEKVPDNLVLEISGGKVKRVDAGGEKLLRSYIGTRKALNEINKDKK